MKVWMRAGDQDDYHLFDSVEEAAEDLHAILHAGMDEECIGHEVNRYRGSALTGIECEGMSGYNGISLFWGDDEAQIDRPLSDDEVNVFAGVLGDRDYDREEELAESHQTR